MFHSRWRAARLLLFITALGSMVWANGLHADEPPTQGPSSQDLEQRVRELEEIVRQLKADRGGPVGHQDEGEEGGAPEGKAPLPPKDVQKLVDNYLKAKDVAAKKADEQKKKDTADKGHEVGSDLSFKASWKNGLNFETANKDFKVHVGGRAQVDAAWFKPDDGMKIAFPTPPNGNNWQDGADLRRARLRVDGTIWEVCDWVWEWEFSTALSNYTNNAPTSNQITHAVPTDVYMDLRGAPIGNVRVGHFKVPFSLEDYGTSDSFLTFMERSTPNDAFTPNRKIGVMLYDTLCAQRLAWAVGAFRGSNDFNASGNSFDYGDGEYLYAGRLTWNPWYAEDGRYWLHFGGAWLLRTLDPQDVSPGGGNNVNRARFASRAPIRVGSPQILDTTALVASNYQEWNLEAALNIGPLSFQSEFYGVQTADVVRGNVSRSDLRLTNPAFWGVYGQVSYLLTGEYHPYLRNVGGIGRVVPTEPYFWVRRSQHCHGSVFGRGAWEIAARYEILDLNSEALGRFFAIPNVGGSAVAPVGTNYGVERDILLGLNWYLNANFRFQWNYCKAWREVPVTSGNNGMVDIYGMRLTWDF